MSSGPQRRAILADPIAATMPLVGVPLEGLETALAAVLLERGRQAQEWGGAEHDDRHTPEEWRTFVHHQLAAAPTFPGPGFPGEFRGRMVRIAALALAAIESRDRLAAALLLEVRREHPEEPPGAGVVPGCGHVECLGPTCDLERGAGS